MARFDVLVAGGGLGGLAAAVDLARTGRSVCVLEAGEVAGGYAANFTRGRYRFDASLHLLDAVHPGGANRPVWERLGLHERVELVTPPLLRRELWPEHTADLGQGLDSWLDVLGGFFPAERDGLRAVADLALAVQSDVLADRDARLGGRLPPPMGPHVAALLDRTAAQVLRDHLTDDRLVAMVGSLSCYLGLGAEDLAAIPFLTMFAGYHLGSGTYPVGGSGRIARALEAELLALGGILRTGSRVVRLPCHHGSVRGAVLQSGERIEGEVVVANLSPSVLYGTLVDRDQVDRRFLRRLERMALGTSVVKAWLGTATDPAPDLPYECFLRTGYRTTFGDGTLDDIDVVASHRLDPGAAPPGGGVFAITVGTEADLSDEARQRYRSTIDQAVRIARERLFPDLRIELESVATPATFERYTSSPGGTIHGFRPIPAHSGPRRLGVTGPIEGLYQVGGWTYAGSGFVPAMTSGLVAAAAIEGRL